MGLVVTMWGKLAVLGLGLMTLAACEPQSTQPSDDDITGPMRVVDGDTLRAGAIRIRLHAIDAPERAQVCHGATGAAYPCGAVSRAALAELIAGDPVRCAPVDTDRYGRVVAKCFARDADLGAAMVARGMAVAFRRYGLDYVRAENAAQDGGLGLWAGPFEFPWMHRQNQMN